MNVPPYIREMFSVPNYKTAALTSRTAALELRKPMART
jgi:hypothetical protein